jgi:predicted adenylyl cyclase CyaB
MPRNVEIKARVFDRPGLEAIVAGLAERGPELIVQDDTFFACPRGRLKLRDFGNGRGELIAYERPDASGPKTSDYSITSTAHPEGLRQALTRALGTIGRVRKQRTLYLIGRTRVHLDRVEGLGEHLELEVVLDVAEDAACGEAEARTLLQRLGIGAGALVAGAYLDLLRCE